MNVKRFRGGLVFKAHRLLYHSTLGSRVTKKKRRRLGWTLASSTEIKAEGSGFRVQGSGCRVQVQGAGFRVQGSEFRVHGSEQVGTDPREELGRAFRRNR